MIRYDVILPASSSGGLPLSYDSDGVVSGGSALGVLQRLLAQRFGLVTHRERQSMPVYDLVAPAAAPGPDLKRSQASCEGADPVNRCEFRSGPGFIVVQGRSMRMLATQLAWNFPAVDRPVRDRTGLEGIYDFTISFVPAFLSSPNRAAPNVPNPAAAAGGASLFQTIEGRLGLRLEERVDALDVMVIDSVQPLSN
jgi:uncharacterized protein (TIGR03435 family)